MNTNTDHATPELFAALSKAQGEIENASKNTVNGAFSKNGKPSYADLAEIINTIRPVFATHGLSLSQFPGFNGSLASVTTIVAHSSGGYISAVASCVPAKSDAQGIGSATTYLRRYSAAAAAGIAQEDDDGNAAAHESKPVPLDQAWLDKLAAASAESEADSVKAEMKAKFGSKVPPALVQAYQARVAAIRAKAA